jgi:hypothetical protein
MRVLTSLPTIGTTASFREEMEEKFKAEIAAAEEPAVRTSRRSSSRTGSASTTGQSLRSKDKEANNASN